jgi:hypothetical protein
MFDGRDDSCRGKRDAINGLSQPAIRVSCRMRWIARSHFAAGTGTTTKPG